MGSTNVLIGASLLTICSLYLFIKLKESIENNKANNAKLSLAGNYAFVKDDPFTPFFMLLSFGIFLFSVFLIGSIGYEDYNYCSTLPANITSVNSSLTQMDYSRICFTNTNTSANMLYSLSNFFIWAIIILFSAMSIYFIFQFVRDNVYEKYKKK